MSESETSEFLNALFGSYEGEIAFDLDGQSVHSADPKFIAENADQLYLIARTPSDQACFVWGIMPEAPSSGWSEFQREPTAVLFRPDEGTPEGTLIAFWAFETAFDSDVVQPLAEALDCNLDEPVPMPNVNGWELVHHDVNRFYAFDELMSVYGPDDTSEAVEASPEPETLPEQPEPQPEPEAAPWEPIRVADALVMTPGWDPQTDPRMAEPTVVSPGRNADSKQWPAKTMSRGQFLALLCSHKEGPKDGPGFVGGEVIGERRKAQAMKQLTCVGLDIDTGMAPAKIDEVLAKLGCIAVRYTTHSNMKTETDFAKSRVVKFANEHGFDPEDLDDATIQAFMRQAEKFEDDIVDSAEFVGVEHTERGIMVQVSHKPIPKNRIVLPFLVPFVVANEGQTQQDAIAKWKKIPTALAQMLGVPIDTTGVDPSRLFYLPRHKKGRPHEIVLFGGDLFDWRSLELDDPFVKMGEEMAGGGGKGKSKSKTQEGRDLGKWSKGYATGFQIVDAIREHCPDRIRAEVQAGIEIECPFDEDHNNAGDTDDRACLAVNAGEGTSEIFTVSCRHEGCQDKTALDMLGKMLKDQWFDKKVTTSETFNNVILEDATEKEDQPHEPDQPQPEPDKKAAESKRVRQEIKAQEGLPALLESMTKESTPEEMRVVTDEIAKLPNKLEIDSALRTMKTRTGMPVATLRAQVMQAWKPAKGDDADKPEEIEDKRTGRVIFRYYSNFNSDDASECCKRTLRRENVEMPTFSSTLDQPVRLRVDPDTSRLSFIELDQVGFWAELCDRIFFQRKTDQGDGPRDQVPKDTAAQLFKTAWKDLPQTPEIIYTPLYTEEGTLIREPGWYQNRSLLLADIGFDVPEVTPDPSAEEVYEAKQFLIEDVLGDFPFNDMHLDGTESPDASRANALAMIITPFMRRMIGGCTPVFFVSKPVAGTGGTLLGKLPMLLFDGEDGFPMSYHKDNDDEQRKALLSAIMETRSHLFFDDVKEFNSRVLLQSITARKIGGRILGKSLNAERPNRFNWVSTGNNPFIGSEMERRICWIRLNAKTEDIQKRVFRHKDYPKFIEQNRGRCVHAVLTLIQSWIANGRQRFEERRLVSFEEWAAMIGGVLENAGIDGFLDNRRPPAADLDQAAVRQFVRQWIKVFHEKDVTWGDLLAKAIDQELDIIEGSSDDQKKFRFRRRLESMEGQTFMIEDARYTIQKTLDKEGDPTYRMVLMPPLEAPSA